MRNALLGLCLALVAAWAPPASADGYPSKPIKMIVPFTPGTGIDNIARAVGAKMTERLHEAVVVENRTGVAGNLGAKMVGQAVADGHTLLVTSNNLTINAHLYQDKDFDAMRDLVPLSIGAWGNSTLVARPNLKINTLAELIAYAKANPSQLTFASSGVGSPMHIQLEQFQAATGLRFQHVPYKGTAPAAADLMGDHVDLAFLATHTVAPNVLSGKLKAIAVGAQNRHRVLPNVPSFGELGLTNVSTDMWYGFLAPRKTPPEVLAKLNSEIVAILAMPDVKASLEKTGLEVRATSADEMTTVLRKEYEDFGVVIRKTNMKAEQ
ncbi:Bug family tripartite tricarboxylate transporter substrate binding protein [Pseudorhodoferax sp.]|uniref:Bug family tripartite tricarboxylate transporter substrate binding protein n=1 Tax=Pseudorhodoferax sp. TaxID=1993553 RepID=UPI002DD69AEB|nr:tripartite tricarboxylate transporter substrate binding protein [Pseudorhodoferax sp.]